MRKYSEFFKTLHDEKGPTGTLGRGTHYSILRAAVFQDVAGILLPTAHFLDFAVIWDEDHDERIMEAIEKVYFTGILSPFCVFGERKGNFTAVLTNPPFNRATLSSLNDRLNHITGSLENGDCWPATVTTIGSSDNYIINDQPERVTLYLNNLKMLWELGLKAIDDSRAHLAQKAAQGVTLEISKIDNKGGFAISLRDGKRGAELHSGHYSFDRALCMAEELSRESGFDGYYEIRDRTQAAGNLTFATHAEWHSALTEIDRQLAPLRDKSGLDWTSKGGPITPDDLAKIPRLGPHVAQMMNLRADIHRRRIVQP